MSHRGFLLIAISFLCGLTVSCETSQSRAGTPVMALREPALVRPLVDLGSPDRSPFPSDRFTVADADQNTGRRVILPMPLDCTIAASECEDRAVLNQFDGFNMQARISVPFEGDIDPASVTSKTVFVLKLRDALTGREDGREIVGINYIVWDPATRELSFRPETALDQHATYALVVTTGIRDRSGHAIGVAEGFRRYRDDLARDADPYYRGALVNAGERVRGTMARGVDIAALSVFTTQTATHILERIRDATRSAPAPTIDFVVGHDGARAVFSVASLASVTFNAQTGASGTITPMPLANFVANMRLIPGAVASIAFGRFTALDFTRHPSGHIAPIATRTGVLAPTGAVDVGVTVWLPSGTRPAAGWPVEICAHGTGANKNFCASQSSIANSRGIAVIAINAMGHGHGPRSTMTMQLTTARR